MFRGINVAWVAFENVNKIWPAGAMQLRNI